MTSPRSTPKFGPREYTYEQLAEAAHRFSHRYLLGVGGFGEVYEGSLHGKTYAIKKLRNLQGEGMREGLEHEIWVISSVSHRNLVKLVGYCIDGANGLLVLEYFPNKSLRVNLHEKKILDWPKRMQIAKGTARGLEYLHDHCTGNDKIIHQDIKPDNILLDDNFEPKIADFGLALIFSDSVSHITRTKLGTEVYMDPEPSKISPHTSDIYSFGVVLLELITGKESKFGNEKDIVKWAKTRIKQALIEDYKGFVDPELPLYNKKELKQMIYCAAACVYNTSECRPLMKQVVRILEGDLSLETLWIDNDLQRFTINKETASSSGIKRFQPYKLSYQQLAAGTEGFLWNILCQVYKGYLNGQPVKVKKFTYTPGKKEDACEHIKAVSSSIYHNNLINLIGFCIEQHNRLLVYEFFSEDKSLRSYLHGNVTSTIDWPTRRKIALSIARGMADLHKLYKPWKIYEEYKDDGIFLDGNFQFAENGRGNVRLGNASSPLQYPKVDVYFFGEILMKLITGQESTNDGVHISEWNKFNEDELILMIKCALAYVQRDAFNRPYMNQNSKALWDALTTCGSGGDALQIYDLHNQVSRQTQGQQTLKQYWNNLQELWMAIDRRRPNPMKSDEDITIYNKITQENRLFNFLGGLDAQYDVIRREILRLEPLPSVESAYATVRKEATRLNILKLATNEDVNSSSSEGLSAELIFRNSGKKSQGRGQRNRTDYSERSRKSWVDKSKLHCSHCGMFKHTKETCFKLVGFPEWWKDGHKPRKPDNSKAAVAVGNREATGSNKGIPDEGLNTGEEDNRGFAIAPLPPRSKDPNKRHYLFYLFIIFLCFIFFFHIRYKI